MAASATPNRSGSPILVIDDEEVVRLLFQSLLEEEGIPVLLAESGRTGVSLLERHNPPLVLVDKNLPDISGLELITEQKRRFPNIEFIMITGYASLDSAVRAMEVGAFSYLTKPFSDMSVVLDRIRAALEVGQLRSETSLLRERLAGLAEPPSHSASTASVRSAVKRLSTRAAERIQHTVELLDSFTDKRQQPPPAAIWARFVDMLSEEARRLRELLGDPPAE